MRLAAATLALAWLAAAPAARAQGGAATQTVLVLRGPAALGAEDERLVEALRIYTRDRDCRLVVEGEAPASSEARAAGEVAARMRRGGAALAVWVGRRADGRAAYYVLTAAGGDLRETEIAPLGPERAAVDVALKVRALLALPTPRAAETERAPTGDVGATASGPASASPPSSRGAPPPAPPRPPSEAAPPRPSEPSVAPAPTLVARAAPPEPEAPPTPERFGLGVAYGVFLPTDPTWVRQGLVVAAEARVAQLAGAPLALAADVAFVNRPARDVRGFETTLADTPLGVGALVRGRWGRLGAACGPRLGVHLLEVTAVAADSRRGASRRAAFGLGGRVEADLRLFAHMKVYLGATFEALIPKQEFTIAGEPALDTGSVLVAGTAGIALLIL